MTDILTDGVPPLTGDKDPTPSSEARYDLTETELKVLESEIVEFAESLVTEPGIVAVWIDPKHRLSNFVRTHEASYFPEVADVSPEDEWNTAFLALVDTRDTAKRVVHGATVMGEMFNKTKETMPDEATGFYTIDSLIELENFTASEFNEYYESRGVDLSKSMSVETNFRIGEKAEPYQGLSTAELIYITLFRTLMSQNPDQEGAVMFATMNSRQIASFARVGVKYDFLLGRQGLVTEESKLGIESLPVTLPIVEDNVAIVGNNGIKIPQILIS